VYEAGELDQAETLLAEGSEAAAAARVPVLEARIRVLLADVRNMRGGGETETLAECEAAAAVLESGNDLDGLAEALTSVGRQRFWLGDVAGGQVALERAIACARQGGNHRAQMRASHWLAVTFHVLPIPVPAAVARAEQLLQTASGDPWAEADLLKPLCVLYAYLGRSADARTAFRRSQSIFAGFGAKLALAESAIPAGTVGLVIGDPDAAERSLREGYEACRAMGERGYVFALGDLLAEALYAQGRFDEAQQVLEEFQADATPDAIEAHVGALIEAKLLARRGQFAAARQLTDQEQAHLPPTAPPLHQADLLETKAEVDRLAGAPDQAAASLRAALRIYEDRGATALAGRTRAALASLAGPPSAKRA
jgi:tetratricopeptide (TPR) repeat protein